MIIDVPFQYEATIRRRRKMKDEQILVSDICHVILEEVSGEDAPLVLLMQAPDEQYSRQNRLVEVRHMEGRFWRQPVVHSVSSGPETSPSIEDIKTAASKQQRLYGSGPLSLPNFWQTHDRLRGSVDSLDNPDIKTLVSTKRDECLERCHTTAARYLLVDGQVFVETPEPVVKVDYRVGGSQGLLPTVKIIPLPNDDKDLQGCFRADRAAAALELFEANIGPLTQAERQAFFEEMPVIHLEGIFAYDDEGHAFDRAVHGAFEPLGAMLRDGSKPFMMAYADLRDALIALRRQECELSDLLGAVARMRDVMEMEASQHNSVASFTRALERWERFHGNVSDDVLLSSMAP